MKKIKDLSADASMPDDRSPGIQVSRVRTHFDVFGFARFGRVQPEIRGRRDIDEVSPRGTYGCVRFNPQAFREPKNIAFQARLTER